VRVRVSVRVRVRCTVLEIGVELLRYRREPPLRVAHLVRGRGRG
jgi:hypothetical protein